jgi:Alpha/beta hydrolase domain containing 18
MSWLEQRIRRYEHRRWTTDDNRRVRPFDWGLEHIGGTVLDPEPRVFLSDWIARTLAHSEAWFEANPAPDYALGPCENGAPGDRILTFTSAVTSRWAENNRVYARLFAASKSGPAVVVLPQWNAKWDVQVKICLWLNRWGITALRLSMPYHDRRTIAGHERADHLVGPNIGLTLEANRQAVLDVRRCLHWLAEQGYGKLGLVGTSIGSAVGFITMAHEPLVRAGVFLHVSTYFADVVRTGMNTAHVWESLRTRVSADELRRFWSPISPFPYVSRMQASRQKMLMVSARYDPTFLPEFSDGIIREVRKTGMESEVLLLPCGHYSLERAPFSYATALRMASFLFRHLA